jgi:hypothetical protein
MEQEEKQLVCYVIRHGDREIELTELRNYLRDRLPAYMAPSEFVLIDELPLTANGKIDRARLPKAKESVLKLEEDYAPPRNEVEQIITGIWEEILAGQRIVDRIGVNDMEVFQHPTIRGLARYLAEEREKEGAVAKGEDRATIRKNLSRGAKRHSRAN